MKALIKIIEKVLELNAPLEELHLYLFSKKAYEGKQVLNLLVTSGIRSLTKLGLSNL